MKGVTALFEGFRLLLTPGLKRFVLVPLTVNILVFIALMITLIGAMGGWVIAAAEYLPDWLYWLTWLIQPLAFILALVLFVFGFTVINGFIAAPFYGLLAEKVEQHLDPNASLPAESFGSMVVRTLKRELQKWLWYIPRALILLLVSLIPVVNLMAPFLWLAFGAWVMVIEYRDYLNDNHGQPLSLTREQARAEWLNSGVFGLLVLLLVSIPFVNLLLPSAAVAGATAWGVKNRSIQARLTTDV